MSYNMPPGVSVNDIPGNRPEDLAADEFWEKLGESCPDVPEQIWGDEVVQKLVESARDLAFSTGFNAGRAEAELDTAARESVSAEPQPQDRDEARAFVAQCFRMRHVHPRWRQWLRQALVEARQSDSVDPQARLEYLRGELRAEQISWGELAELQGLAAHIDPSDVELLEAAGVPEGGPCTDTECWCDESDGPDTCTRR
jgi:hypothetical protein